MEFITTAGKYRFLEIRIYGYSPLNYKYLLRTSPKDVDEWIHRCQEEQPGTPHTIAYYSDPNDLIMDFRRHLGCMYGEVLGHIISDIWPAKNCLKVDYKGELV